MSNRQMTKRERVQMGRRIRAARQTAGFESARAMAREIDCDPSYYSLIERGERTPGFAILHTISELTGVRLVELLGEEPKDRLATELCSKAGTETVRALLEIPPEHLRMELETILRRWESARDHAKRAS